MSSMPVKVGDIARFQRCRRHSNGVKENTGFPVIGLVVESNDWRDPYIGLLFLPLGRGKGGMWIEYFHPDDLLEIVC